MKTFFLKLSFLLLLVVGSFVLLFLVPSPYDHTLSLLINKMKIMKDTPSPRYVLVGGSGLFGAFDSGRLAAESGRHVVNMGFYAGFGIPKVLEAVDPLLLPGDVVLIVPEYSVISADFKNTEETRKWLLAASPALRSKDYLRSLEGLRLLLRDLLDLSRSKITVFGSIVRGRPPGYVYAHTLLDPHGDALKMANRLPQPLDKGIQYAFRVTPETLQELNAFDARVRSLGGETVFVWPAFTTGEYEINRAGIEATHQLLKENLDFTILGEPRDFLYPYEYFLDTIYHLDARGKALRTEKVISLLKKNGIGMPHEPA